MKIYSRTYTYHRKELHFDRHGITIRRLRRSTTKGWYVKDYESIDWPWVNYED